MMMVEGEGDGWKGQMVSDGEETLNSPGRNNFSTCIYNHNLNGKDLNRQKGGNTRRGEGKVSFNNGGRGGREKPAHLVARRNARERRRVQAVNGAFTRLRNVLPLENRGKRVSKVKTLQRAIDYIAHLASLLAESPPHSSPYARYHDHIQEHLSSFQEHLHHHHHRMSPPSHHHHQPGLTCRAHPYPQ
ncbi:unnamed protein product [Darwinula stevensoni]|uniref:BHLH domain-containing protein n=1 Tax=Darwinula stevensoni TaxID=69355 RepID=A0A7R9A068_9CRUS|nr:unnamed protein product [Darwinula stevensoni]CAG0884984.1 unnamed protein product [Darwinula stevensoni]